MLRAELCHTLPALGHVLKQVVGLFCLLLPGLHVLQRKFEALVWDLKFGFHQAPRICRAGQPGWECAFALAEHPQGTGMETRTWVSSGGPHLQSRPARL